MLGRVAVLVALVEPALLRTLAIPLAAMTLAALTGLLLTFRRDGGDSAEVELKNPFELGSAIKVTIVFGAVLLASRAASEYLGRGGLYLTSVLAGTTDVDAVTLSSAQLARDGLEALTATVAILIAIAANTVVKTGLAASLGGAALGRRMALVGGLVLVAGVVGLVAGAGLT